MVEDGNKTAKALDSKKCCTQHIQFPSEELILMSNLHSYGKWTGQEGIQHTLLGECSPKEGERGRGMFWCLDLHNETFINGIFIM